MDEVGLDGGESDIEVIGDLRVRRAFADEPDDLALAVREVR